MFNGHGPREPLDAGLLLVLEVFDMMGVLAVYVVIFQRYIGLGGWKEAALCGFEMLLQEALAVSVLKVD
jgi:hypothetical protein